MRWLIPQPCIGASESALSTSRSSVPCRTSEDDAATMSPVECARESMRCFCRMRKGAARRSPVACARPNDDLRKPMRAMLLRRPHSKPPAFDDTTLALADVPIPELDEEQVLIRVSVCGVCRTDLDIAEGRITPPHYPVVPGHQVIGRVTRVGAGVTRHREGDRVGVAW